MTTRFNGLDVISKRCRIVVPLIALAFCLINPSGAMAAIDAANPYDEPVMHPAIPLLDENGNHVKDSGKAYNPIKSCGEGSGCHDYESITHAYHFEFGRDEASDSYGAKRGLPQLTSPGYYGGYNCMSGDVPEYLGKKNNPNPNLFADFGSPGFVRGCLSCHQGGGFGEKDRNGIRYDKKADADIPPYDGDYYVRGYSNANGFMDKTSKDMVNKWDWKKSGVAEADCMICHAKFSDLVKPAELTHIGKEGKDVGAKAVDQYNRILRQGKLIRGGFFDYQASAIWEYLPAYDASGQNPKLMLNMSRTVDETSWDNDKVSRKPDYDLNVGEDGRPILKWNAAAFDADGKAHIKMLRFPGNDNCMICHRTSNSRRGFYGFGDKAVESIDDDGVILSDYKDDVHKGKTFKDSNGEERMIDNCNACHARAYFKPPFKNVEINLDHNFLKGNSDMDIRNDLDYAPNAKSCEYCHDETANPVIPSGQATILDAHRELWKGSGDMAGYPKEQLNKVTQVHLDVVACQTCHITSKFRDGRSGKPATAIPVMYRYRQAADGKQKIFPYNPKPRTYWADKNNDHALSRYELYKIYEPGKDEKGKPVGILMNPETGEECARVSARQSHGSLRYGSPDTYEGVVCQKKAYDKMLREAGVKNPDMEQVLVSSNMYVITHSVRQSTASMPCGDCHTRKQSGAWSSLVSESGVLGSANSREIRTIPDKRLVDDGIFRLGMDYLKVDDNGSITQNVADILYATKVDPFMTIALNSSSPYAFGEFKRMKTADVPLKVIFDERGRNVVGAQISTEDVMVMDSYQGEASLKEAAVIVEANDLAALIYSKSQVEIKVVKPYAELVNGLKSAALGELKSDGFIFTIRDGSRKIQYRSRGERILIKLPYRGNKNSLDQVKVVSSDGEYLRLISAANMIHMQPHTDAADGYVVFATDEDIYGFFAAVDQ